TGLDHTLFVFGADHSTADRFVWSEEGQPSIPTLGARALIPFAIVLPEPLINAAAHPNDLRGIVRELNSVMNRHPWAQNDVPLLVLTLLSHAPTVEALSPDARWHTLGGERTSPFFKPPNDGVEVVGIDCLSGFYGTNETGTPLLPHETASFV